jgi:hypothetical protein
LSIHPAVLRTGVVVLVFGLLLWARFLLVTGHPRTAMADPPATGQVGADTQAQAPARAATDPAP